jgi:hypothetical protein
MGPVLEPLSAADAAWLRMDRPTNPMVITAVMMLHGTLEVGALEAQIREQLLPHPRFHQCVVRTALGRLRWRDEPELLLSSHLHHIAVPVPGDDRALAGLVGDLMGQPLDRSRPLWSMHLVEGHRGGSVIVARLHHCLADGVALVRLLLSLTEHEAPATPAPVGAAPGAERHLLRSAAAVVRSLAHDLRLPPDPPTPLQGRLGVRKRVAWSRPHPLDRLANAAHGAKVTLNDVVLAAVAGALRSYLTARTGSPPPSDLRALVPVNLRRLGTDPEAGNRFGLVYVTLPLTQARAKDRIAVVRQHMEAIKQTPEAVMAFGVLGAMGLASAAVQRFGVDLFTKKATVLVTSIPGPTAPLRLAGREIDALLVWAPASGGIGITISILSYAGRLQIGIGADAQLVPDPDTIALVLDDELAAAPGWLVP